MSNYKKLNLTYDKLVGIAKALNENLINRRNSPNDDTLLDTDKFIKKNFGINRKDFSATIKGTGISYNASRRLYDIDINTGSKDVNKETTYMVYQSNQKENLNKMPLNNEVNKIDTKSKPSENKSVQEYTNKLPKEFKEFLYLIPDLKEMLEWYKKQNNPNIVERPQLNVNNDENLTGDVTTRSFKMYVNVSNMFNKFAKSRKESQKDLISLALLEFIKKYE